MLRIADQLQNCEQASGYVVINMINPQQKGIGNSNLPLPSGVN